MQGQKGTIDNLPEGLVMEHGSSSNDSSVIEQQICWNSNNYIRNPPNQDTQNISMWSMGESSSNSVSQDRINPKTAEHVWPPVNMNSNHNHGPIPHNVIPTTFIPIKPSTFPGSSSSNPFDIDAQGQGHSRLLPCKRKAADLSASSSNVFQNSSPVNDLSIDPTIPRIGLGVGSEIENTRRNVRIRINNSRQQEPSVPNPSLRLNTIDLRSPPPVTTIPESSNLNLSSSSNSNSNSNSLIQERQPVLRVPVSRRNLHGSSSRWNRNRSLDNNNSRTIPTNISDHPIFVPPQTAINWNLNSGGNGGGAASSSPVPAPSSVIPNMPLNRGSHPHHPSRRLSEILRRSFLSSMDSSGGGGSLFSRVPPAVGTSETGNLPVVGVPGHNHHRHHHLLPHSRSSDRLFDGAFGFPYLARNVVASGEGRGRLVSEIRNVLDLIRRGQGEGLRLEDVMIFDPSVLYGMADMHDRHRDMRLDIDNMSYEELLALEERIGNVNTGLTEENISTCLKQKTYLTLEDVEPCCICQEEYKNGDGLGGLECGHDFHTNCIKQWLLQKNSCPVCKSAAFKTK